ncbi:MAG: hypothetical protein DI535_17440 [Citrobacter freundii]|nr:MAG: hypothetical protein DI535_17440 [Citrobacter freundii]
MRPRLLTCFAVATLAVFTFISCQKDEDNTTQLSIHLTDSPFDATEVNVDIREVTVKMNDNEPESWTTLHTKAGVYNLLDFQNGIDTVLATGLVPTGPLKEVRFILGSNNSITIDNVNYPLTVPSGSESGLKIKIDKQLRTSVDSLLIDFDAALSIHQTGNGKYILQPVLKVK